MGGATRRRLARSTLSCFVSRILIICFSSMPQSRQHATNGPFPLATMERMETEPKRDVPHENSTCPSASSSSSLDGSQSPVFALQRGEEHNGWPSVPPRWTSQPRLKLESQRFDEPTHSPRKSRTPSRPPRRGPPTRQQGQLRNILHLLLRSHQPRLQLLPGNILHRW